MEWNGIEITLSQYAQERGEKIYTEEDLKEIAEKCRDLLEDPAKYAGTGGGLQAATYAKNRRVLIAKLLNTDVENLRYIEIPPPVTYDKKDIFIHRETKVVADTTGVLISQWTGGDFNDIKYYFVTKK